jgi:hypothetical protein
MANGFKVVGSFTSGNPDGHLRTCYCTGEQIMQGDLVKLAGGTESTGYYPDVTPITGVSDVICGVVVGFRNRPEKALDSGSQYGASTDAVYPIVNFDMRPKLVAQADGALTSSELMYNCKPLIASGDTANGTSGHGIDASEAATTNSLTLKLLGLYQEKGNDISSTSPLVVCTFNIHQFDTDTAGV